MIESKDVAAVRDQLARQVAHWGAAADDLADVTLLAAPAAWRSLERYLGTAIETTLAESVRGLRAQADVLRARLLAAVHERDLADLHRELLRFRRRYLAVEASLDFFGDAINTRTNEKLCAYLSACDFLARESMRPVLEPTGLRVPRVLTYVDKGLGASILKAGLRLWDQQFVSPVAVIKIVRHNLQRPTALIHETGHQVAHLTKWTAQLAAALSNGLSGNRSLADLWSGWASEIAADAFAFVHTGFASLSALHGVLAGEGSWVFRVEPLDPHPSGYVRILLVRAMCQRFFGAGPWDQLARAWIRMYPLENASPETARTFRASLDHLPKIVEIVLEREYAALGGHALVDLVDPARVKPEALLELERLAGPALYVSTDWVRRESLRLLALSGYRAATDTLHAPETLQRQHEWMTRLGELAKAA
ncbi:MAG: hypothetical protein HOW73_33795 [Polyangiaceae bacterium]|nr:hypothetical protein [Polyangiaceae bacterium]